MTARIAADADVEVVGLRSVVKRRFSINMEPFSGSYQDAVSANNIGQRSVRGFRRQQQPGLAASGNVIGSL